MFPASALYGKPASGKAGTWETFQTFLLISTRSCGACWVKNWGELAPVSIIKKHVRKKWRRFVFIVPYVVCQGKITFFLLLKLELWALNRLSYNFKRVKQVYYSPA